ncbi:MAG: class I SAM-dependent methyltransferase [Actinomycetota bacterium]|nr:class I SAM-dependent methyltransferase [Actinomycetota bacterium]
MTTSEQATTDLDQRVETFAESLFDAALATAELTVAWLGRSLGLYAGLRGEPGLTAAELGAKAGVDERYTREWLEHQAVAQVLTVDDPELPARERRYGLSEAHAIALLDEEHASYAGALADLPPIIARSLELVRDAFRSGAGVPFASYGLHDMQAGFTRPMFASSFASEWLAALPDVHRRLQAGEPLRIADLGCGEGWAGIYLAEAYPNVTVDGFDLDDASIAAARRHAAARNVSDRVRFEVKDLRRPDGAARYDLVFTCEVIHDLPDPVGALAAMRRVTEGGGAVLVIDENAAESFQPSGDPIERLLYGFSILHCLPVGRDEESSAATGTVMRPGAFTRYAEEAGFSHVEILPIEHPFFRFYHPVA